MYLKATPCSTALYWQTEWTISIPIVSSHQCQPVFHHPPHNIINCLPTWPCIVSTLSPLVSSKELPSIWPGRTTKTRTAGVGDNLYLWPPLCTGHFCIFYSKYGGTASHRRDSNMMVLCSGLFVTIVLGIMAQIYWSQIIIILRWKAELKLDYWRSKLKFAVLVCFTACCCWGPEIQIIFCGPALQ